MKTMTVKEAWEKSFRICNFAYGSDGHLFAFVGWQSPESNKQFGPFLVTICGNRCIEIDWDGGFKTSYPDVAEYYFPWIIGQKSKKRTEIVRNMAKDILKK